MSRIPTLNKEFLMTTEEGREWNALKADLGPLYPGYPGYDRYLNWMKEKLTGYGCVDVMEHHWTMESYRVNDWPVHDTGVLGLEIDGEEIPVGTFLMLSKSTGPEGLTLPSVFYDSNAGEPEDGAFEGKIVVMKTPDHPVEPYADNYLQSYVVTDTNYRSGPKEPAEMLKKPDPEVNNSWNTRWDFSRWMFVLVEYAIKGGAAGFVIGSDLTWGTLEGLYDRQRKRPCPSIVVDRTQTPKVVEAAKAGKEMKITLISEFFNAESWNFVTFLPGKNYGTDADEYISLNGHMDAMSLTQDNGTIGILGVVRYFAQIPQSEREKTLLCCIDSRHFIEGFESGNMQHDPYVVYPELKEKISVTIGLEHMGEMETRENYANNTMEVTGLPEYTFMVSDDNDWAARLLIRSAVDSGLERADVKIDGRPGIHGLYKGLVRAVQAKTHKLGVAVIGQAGNWCGGHTQTFSVMNVFGDKKFRDEVALWTQVTAGFMATDRKVFDISWNNLNTAIRKAAANGTINEKAKEGLLMGVSNIFRDAEDGEYALAASRLETEIKPAIEWFGEAEDIQAIGTALDSVVACMKA